MRAAQRDQRKRPNRDRQPVADPVHQARTGGRMLDWIKPDASRSRVATDPGCGTGRIGAANELYRSLLASLMAACQPWIFIVAASGLDHPVRRPELQSSRRTAAGIAVDNVVSHADTLVAGRHNDQRLRQAARYGTQSAASSEKSTVTLAIAARQARLKNKIRLGSNGQRPLLGADRGSGRAPVSAIQRYAGRTNP
jgi:hypothetical protein